MNNPRPNPYIGPRAFKTGEVLHGRDRENNELYDLLIAERIVVLHSPSGAGKSSLVYAGLIPRLKDDGFHVLPVARVNLERPLDLLKGDDTQGLQRQFNRYVFSTLLSLEEGLAPEERTDLVHLSRAVLDTYVDLLIQKQHSSEGNPATGNPATGNPATGNPATASHVLILDQFEEILTLDSTDREAKQVFFQQLGTALRNRDIWALFVIREDYLAGLDPYIRPLPTRLANTYRLDLLGVEAAHLAIEGPARAGGVAFTEDTANKLVDDLRRIQMQQPDGSMLEGPGPYIEPVQLQVVCYRLWQNLAAEDTEIDANDLATIGDVNQSLAEYYAAWIAEIAGQTSVSERAIRQWFERQLITEIGIRSQVLMQPEASNGLENKAIWKLVDAHLVRAEKRRNATWFELAHDRLIAPVRQNNAAWFEAHLSDLQRQAERWEYSKRSDALLALDLALQNHQTWADAHPGELTPSEVEYLLASQEAEKQRVEKLHQQEEMKRLELERSRAEEKARNAARLRQLLVLAVVAAAAAVIFAVFAVSQQRVASHESQVAKTQEALAQANERTANAASTRSAGNEAEARANLVVAQTQEAIAAAQKATAVLARATATAALGTAVADRQVAIDKEAAASTAQAEEAVQRARAEANAKLANSRQLAAQAQSFLKTNPSLAGLLAVEAFRTNNTWEARDIILTSLQQNLEQGLQPYGKSPGLQNTFIYAVAVNPKKPYIAWGDKDGAVTIWDYEQGKLVWSKRGKSGSEQDGHTDGVWGLDFSPDGETLASGGQDMKVFLWDVDSGRGTPIDLGQREVFSVSFSPSGDQLAVTAEARVRVYDLTPTIQEHILPNRIGHNAFINDVSWSPNGEWLATSGEDGAVRVWQASNGGLVQNIPIGGKVVGTDWSPDSKFLAAGNSLHNIVLWETDTWKELGRMVHDTTPDNVDNTVVFDVAFVGEGLVASAGNDNRIILWDTNTLNARDTLSLGNGQLRSLKALVAKKPNLLVSGGTDQRVRLFEVKTQRPISASYRNLTDPVAGLWAAEKDSLFTMLQTPTGLKLNDDTTNSAQTVPGKFTSLAISPDGSLVALGGPGGTIQLMNRNNPANKLPRIQAANHTVQSLAFSPDGKQIASSQCILQIAQAKGSPICQENQIDFWNAANGQPAGAPLKLQGETVKALAFHPSEPKMVAGSGSLIYLLDRATGESKSLPPVAQGTGLTSLVFSPDGGLLISAGQDQTIVLRDTYNFLPIGSPLGVSQVILSLAFEPSGQFFFSGGQDGAVERWEANPDLWVQRVCTLTGRNLTPDEIRQFLPDKPDGYKTCP